MRLYLLTFACVFIQMCYAQVHENVKPQEVFAVVDFLSSDVLMGRETATQGELIACLSRYLKPQKRFQMYP